MPSTLPHHPVSSGASRARSWPGVTSALDCGGVVCGRHRQLRSGPVAGAGAGTGLELELRLESERGLGLEMELESELEPELELELEPEPKPELGPALEFELALICQSNEKCAIMISCVYSSPFQFHTEESYASLPEP